MEFNEWPTTEWAELYGVDPKLFTKEEIANHDFDSIGRWGDADWLGGE